MVEAAKEKKFVIPKQTKFDKDLHELGDFVMREDDRVTRWKSVHELLRRNNPTARKEQEQVAKECAEVRAEKLFRKKKTKVMGLRFGVAMPPMTWNALVEADILTFGKSDLQSTDKEDHLDLQGSNQIVKDLEKAFPQYKVS
jgi:hypothetical protein